ncbi:deacetylase [Corynebacterium deserti GIMN1.010]|uniref:Deacetylase n=2 Tax=Corynebacterium TaxID=1716 RepID=A0A0M4CKZ1_9CORY|nr:deacetylase [Corynebacterium deserti GIMN1.010]
MCMSGRLLVSVSSIFDQTRSAADRLIKDLRAEGIEVSLLVAPRIDGDWRLAKDKTTLKWFEQQRERGHELILNGFDQAVQGRRAEFATLESHEARLRLTGAIRQMHKIGFELDIFAPPRWRMSEGTFAVLPEFEFTVAASSRGLHNLEAGDFLACRNLSVGEGFGAAKWWRKNVIRAVTRGAEKGNTVRLSASARNLTNPKVAADFRSAALAALELGASAQTYRQAARQI